MIEYAKEPFSDEESLSVLNPYVRAWFKKNFKELTPPQKYAFKLISEGKNLLITAPTGSGKTMSGFVSIISRLFDYALSGKLDEKVYCIYISPLRALNNDIYRNLTKPLNEIYESIKSNRYVQAGKSLIPTDELKRVTIAVRTGDTPPKERQKMLRNPPNILVTTPESLAIMLNSQKFIESLASTEFVIIDEIHELANNKRGSHLALSIERFAAILGRDFTRIGLGATLHPLEEAAKFLVGYSGGKPRDCIIVDASWSKKLDIETMSPLKDMIYSNEKQIEDAIYSTINGIIKKGKTTLVFTNTRSGTERVVFNLKKRFKYGDDIAAHHGSLSRETRLEVEETLKKGGLKCAVSSTSLELGVDIGAIDAVVQLGSPKSVTRLVQRIGRAGHSFKETAVGRIVVLNRDDLVECSIMAANALEKKLDSFSIIFNALDVLAQHIVGMSLTKKWNVDEAFEVVRRAYPYHDLQKRDFIALLNYLAGNYVGLESRSVYGKIWYDEKENMFGRRGRYAKVIYMLNLGTIPDEVSASVIIASTKKWVGNIEEEFLARLKPGDIFTLGGRLYKFEYAKGMKCFVSEAESSAPTIPPWFSEQLPLSFELAMRIGDFRLEMLNIVANYLKKASFRKARHSALPEEADALLSKLPINANAKTALFNYFVEQFLFAGYIPNRNLLLIEATYDGKSGKHYLVFHALFGRRINDALSRLFAMLLGDALDQDIGVMVHDNGFVLMPEDAKVTKVMIDDAFAELLNSDIEAMLRSNLRNTELLKRHFRHVAARSFMILKNYKGWKIAIGKQQFNSQLLFKAIESEYPDFPIINEAYREVLNDVMDLVTLKEILKSIANGPLKYKFIETPTPSPFAHTLITFGSADVVQMKGRVKYLQYLHRQVMKRIKPMQGWLARQ
ncbi:MAG: ATP-dependent helicase [Candidatus Micrarchaeaceae archaeon]